MYHNGLVISWPICHSFCAPQNALEVKHGSITTEPFDRKQRPPISKTGVLCGQIYTITTLPDAACRSLQPPRPPFVDGTAKPSALHVKAKSAALGTEVDAPVYTPLAAFSTSVKSMAAAVPIAGSTVHTQLPRVPPYATGPVPLSVAAASSPNPFRPKASLRPREQNTPPVIAPYPSYSSPINVEQFKLELAQHPDRPTAQYIINGLEHGFSLMFAPGSKLKPTIANCISACKHPKVIDDYLLKETNLGRVAGPFITSPLPNLHISRFGVIPKKSNNEWRLILDLSHPEGFSVNDGINPNSCHTQYCKVDDAIKLIMSTGKGALMAKLDVKSAYRILAVHPSDHYLLGMKWRSKFYVDLALPFGLRSAPFIFNKVADMLAWILQHNYDIENLIHYLDDYFTLGPADSDQCKTNLATITDVCARLGVPLAPEKCVGPTTCMVFLGIELDSVESCARLPSDKLTELRRLIPLWLDKKSCTRRELESLVGKLQHASAVVRPGRTFLRRLLF